MLVFSNRTGWFSYFVGLAPGGPRRHGKRFSLGLPGQCESMPHPCLWMEDKLQCSEGAGRVSLQCDWLYLAVTVPGTRAGQMLALPASRGLASC